MTLRPWTRTFNNTAAAQKTHTLLLDASMVPSMQELTTFGPQLSLCVPSIGGKPKSLTIRMFFSM
jgi:hypothetical protein